MNDNTIPVTTNQTLLLLSNPILVYQSFSSRLFVVIVMAPPVIPPSRSRPIPKEPLLVFGSRAMNVRILPLDVVVVAQDTHDLSGSGKNEGKRLRLIRNKL